MTRVSSDQVTSGDEYRNIFEAAVDGLTLYDIGTSSIVEANAAACKMHGFSHNEFIGLNPRVFMLPESHVLFNEHVQTLEPGNVLDSVVIHLRKDGSQFYAEVSRSAITFRGRPCILSVIRDVSLRVQTEQTLSGQINARVREQAILLAISHTLASTLELQPGLVLDQLREIIAYTHGEFFALEDSTLVTLAMRGAPPQEQAEPIHIKLSIPEDLRVLFNDHRPIRIADIWSDEAQAQFLRSLLNDGAAVLLEGMQSWLWVPLAVKGRMIGVMGIAHTDRDYFTAHHADLALSVANQAAITMINVELYGHAQELAVLEERQRLARNLHDAVNQSLFSAGLIAEVLPRLWERDRELARESLEDLRKLTRAAMAEMRTLLAELRPSTLTDAELGDLVRLLGNAFTGRTNIPVNLTVEGTGVLPADVQVAVYRVCQEALNNIAKHARASVVEIDLKHEEFSIALSIRDNGKGFDPELSASGHYGLDMMRERAEAVKAQLSITSKPGSGTELTIRWAEPEKKETP